MKSFALILAVLFTGLTVFGEPTVDRLNESAQALNESVQDVEIGSLLPEISKLLKTETDLLEKAIVYNKQKLSDVALAKFMAEKSSQPIQNFLKSDIDWPKMIEEKKVSINDVREFLDNLASEVSFVVFERKDPGTKAKK